MAKPIVSPVNAKGQFITYTVETTVTPVPDPGNTPSAGAPLNTGDNGFPIDGTKQTYDIGVPDAQAQVNGQPGYGAYKKGVDVSDGYQNADGTPKDLSSPTKTTLAQRSEEHTS